MTNRGITTALVISLFLLAACRPIATLPPPAPKTEIPSEEMDQVISPTLQVGQSATEGEALAETYLPTSTIIWFPPTNTPTPLPTREVTPTPDYRPAFGEVIFSDDFSSPGPWTLGNTASSSVAFGINELTIALKEPHTYQFSAREEPILSDFYLEITASPTLCRGEDEYGLLLRMTSPEDFYRFSLSCDGRVRLERVTDGTASMRQTWMQSAAVPPGAPSVSRLAVWALDEEMRFFANEEFLFKITDSMLLDGRIGVFARSAGDTAVTINFSDLLVRQINQ